VALHWVGVLYGQPQENRHMTLLDGYMMMMMMMMTTTTTIIYLFAA